MSETHSYPLKLQLRHYLIDLKRRMEADQPVVVGWRNFSNKPEKTEFYIKNMVDLIDRQSDQCHSRFDLVFECNSKTKRIHVVIFLDDRFRWVSVIMDPQFVYEHYDDQLKVPLVVGYSDTNGGKFIRLQPTEGKPEIHPEVVSLAEVLLNEVTVGLSMVPDAPFDFESVRKYIIRQWSVYFDSGICRDFSWYRKKINEAWDDSLDDVVW